MNKILTFLACFIFVFIAFGSISAQKKTIILVRHAEKADASQDPELSAEGKQRAQRLAKLVGKYKPGAFYSTDFKRTRGTAEPLAEKRKKPIETYDARKPKELIDAIMKSRTKRFLVTGHSNTIPGLVNAFGKKELFKNLDDAEYGTIWILRLKDGQIVKTEIIPY